MDNAVPLKRCPKGSRKNKKTGICESQAQVQAPVKRCPKGSKKNKKTGLCESQAHAQVPVKRCPNGSQKNKKTGLCESHAQVPVSPASPVTPPGPPPASPVTPPGPPPASPVTPPASHVAEKKLKSPETKNANTNNKMVLQFHSKSALLKNHVLPPDALRRLSNFSEDSVEFDGNVYPSVEHAFQAQKYMCSNKPELAQMFYNGKIESAVDAKLAGGKGGMKKHGATMDVACWDKTKDGVMNALIKSKIHRNEYIRSILKIASDNNIKFVHFSRSDMYWGAHVNADGSIKAGLNKLGEIYNEYI